LNESKLMTQERIPKLMLKFSLPAIIGLLVNALYNIIDSIFVGNGVGDLALAGVTVCFPFITAYMACIMLIGMGATSLISIRLGEKKEGEAEKIVGNAFVLFLIIGVIITLLGLIFLKPILIFFGASPDVLPFATIISYSVTSTWVLYHFLSGKSTLKIKLENLKLKRLVVNSILLIGFPTFVLQVTGSIQQLILNRSLAHYGGDTALAVIGIIMSIVTLLVMPAMGISQGAQPIIGFNYGARQFKRVKDTLKLSIVSATALVTIGFVFSKIWPTQLISLFNDKPELIELGVHGMDIFFKFLPLIGMQMISASYFQAVGKPNQATLLSLSRQIIIFIPLLIVLPLYWGLEGVWWSGPFSDLGAFILTGLWLWVEIKRLNKDSSIHNKS